MPRVRSRTAHRLRHDGRFARTEEEEVRYGVNWADCRHRLSPFLLPTAGDSFEKALGAVKEARANELMADLDGPGEPGVRPPWATWEGLDR